MLTVSLALVCAAYGARTFAQTAMWQDEEALFRAAVALRKGGGAAASPAAVPGFDCAGYLLDVESVPGHPREVARRMAGIP